MTVTPPPPAKSDAASSPPLQRAQRYASAEQFSESGFRDKLRRAGRRAGRAVVEKALQLYLAARSSETPTWAKTAILTALAYFILPADAIPDLIPTAGFADDLATLAAAAAAVHGCISPEMREQARSRADAWLGDSPHPRGEPG